MELVTIRAPFPAHAWPRVWTWMESFRSRVADDFGPQTLQDFVALREAATNEFTWGVYRGEELGGLISYQPANPITGVTHCLFKRSFWGRETTLTALRLAYAEIFRAGVLNIQSCVFEDNHAIRSLGKAMGAREVATLRCSTMRGGKPISVVLFEMFEEDFRNALVSNDPRPHGRERSDDKKVQHDHPNVEPRPAGDTGRPFQLAQAANVGQRSGAHDGGAQCGDRHD